MLVSWYPTEGTKQLGTTGYLYPERIVQGETRKHPHGQLVGPAPNLERMFLQENLTAY